MKDLEIIKGVFDEMTWPYNECAEIEQGQARDIIQAAERMQTEIDNLREANNLKNSYIEELKREVAAK